MVHNFSFGPAVFKLSLVRHTNDSTLCVKIDVVSFLGGIYARVSSKEQEREGYSIPAQCKLLRSYAQRNGFAVVHEFIDVETAKQSGRTHFTEMIRFLEAYTEVRTLLCEKTDRLYRNFKDYVIIDELDLTLIFVKEGSVLNKSSRSHEKFIHGIKVLMAKNYIDNLSEETRKGMLEKAEEGEFPAPLRLGTCTTR